MSDGQLAMNTNLASPGLFLKDTNGDLVKVGPVHVGTTAPNVTPGAGGQAGNSKGEQWLDTTGGVYVFKVWDGTAWLTTIGGGGATGSGGDEVFHENDQAVTTTYTLTSGKNAISAGPVTINSGATVTVPAGASWSIV
jgi:hypothetical protein